MKALPDITPMFTGKRRMTAGTTKMFFIAGVLNMENRYFHNGGRYCHFPPSFEVLLRGKYTTIVRYFFKQISAKNLIGNNYRGNIR
jgi:hypothetical protein